MTSLANIVVSHALSSLELISVSPDILVIDIPGGTSAVWAGAVASRVRRVVMLEVALGTAFFALPVHYLFAGMSYGVPSGAACVVTLHLEHSFKADSSG